MDHSYPTATSFQPLPPEVTATGARMVSYLHAGGRAIVLVGPRRSGKTTTLDAIFAGMPAWVERVSNRLQQPLSLPRILTQIDAQPGSDQAASLLQTLLDRASPTEPAVLAVDDAHTLTPEALSVLARVPGLGGPDIPGVVLLLAGEPELLRRLNGPAMASLRGPSALTLRMPARGAMAAACGMPQGALEVQVAGASRRWPILLGMAAAALLATALLLAPPLVDPKGDQVSAEAVQPAPAAPAAVAVAEPPAAAPGPGPAPGPAPVQAQSTDPAPEPPAAKGAGNPQEGDGAVLRAARPSVTDDQLRRGFDAFLDHAGRDTRLLAPPAREALFREYLAWKARSN